MSIKEMEAELEATRQKIAEQLSLVGKSIQSIDPKLHEKERELEQAVIDAHLDTPVNMQAKGRLNAFLQDLPYVAPSLDLSDLLAEYDQGDKS